MSWFWCWSREQKKCDNVFLVEISTHEYDWTTYSGLLSSRSWRPRNLRTICSKECKEIAREAEFMKLCAKGFWQFRMLLAIDGSSSTFILHSLFVELARSVPKPLSRGESSPPGFLYSFCISAAEGSSWSFQRRGNLRLWPKIKAPSSMRHAGLRNPLPQAFCNPGGSRTWTRSHCTVMLLQLHSSNVLSGVCQ